LIKITQRTNIKLKVIKFYHKFLSFELQYMLDDDNKNFMTITLNFYSK